MSVTIKDIAKIAGVSHTTVSRALNDSPLISESKKKEILKIAQKHNYVPNMLARGLSRKRSYTVGIIINFFGNVFVQRIMKGVENIAEKNDYVMIFGDSREDAKREAKYIKTFAERGVDGLIIYPVTTPDSATNIPLLKKLKIPYVMVNHQPHRTKSDLVACDHFQAGYKATRYLLSLNHNNIGLIGGPGINEKSDIVQGLMAAYSDAGKNYYPDFLSIFQGFYHDFDTIAKATVDLLEKNPQLTALISYADEIIPGIAKALEKLHLNVPENISLVSYGNMKKMTEAYYDLTSIKYSTNLVGEEAMKLLLNKVNSNSSVLQQLLIPVDLYKGTSCRKI